MRFGMARCLITVTVFVSSTLLPAAEAMAAVPPNDDWRTATPIDALPFTVTQDTTEATTQFSNCGSVDNVWFALTPSRRMAVRADTFGSNYWTGMGVYVMWYGYPELIACQSNAPTGWQSEVTIQVFPGNTYLFAAGGWDSGGQLVFNMGEVPIPENDDFANATPITDLPFEETADIPAASSEPSEPIPSCTGEAEHTVWYAFVPPEDLFLTAEVTTAGSPIQAIYSGTALGELTEVACRANTSPLSFHAVRGVTYFIQVGDAWATGFPAALSLQVAPEPLADFGVSDSCLSTSWDVGFMDQSSDPGGMRIVSSSWGFGDGSTGTGLYVDHRYAADGTYAVTLTIETADGRVAAVTRPIFVGTHDVSVTGIDTPAVARSRQTKIIQVHVRNTRFPEGVTVSLFVSIPGGVREAASLWQLVGVRIGATTDFGIPYTFSRNDSIKRVTTFIATASIDGCPDGFPDDNQMTSAPVKVIG